jgi:hypothetical protein
LRNFPEKFGRHTASESPPRRDIFDGKGADKRRKAFHALQEVLSGVGDVMHTCMVHWAAIDRALLAILKLLVPAGSWRDPCCPTPRAETASLGCVDPMHRFRTLSPRSRAVSRELSQFGRQVGFSAPAAHVARKSRMFWRISRAGTFDRR